MIRTHPGKLNLLLVFILSTNCAVARAQEAPSASQPPLGNADVTQQTPAPAEAQEVGRIPNSHFDKAMFLKPIPADQLLFLKAFEGAPSYDLYRDKEFRKLMKSIVPECMFHYGRDKPLKDALDEVFDHSREPVQIREGRYVMLSGLSGQYLSGRGFLWIDMQDGIGLGGFYFRPTNGEPTPAMNIFSRQVKEDALSLSELPPPFAQDFTQWTMESSVPPVTVRYFLTGENRKILLEHDEDFCLYPDGSPVQAGSGCEQRNADAADFDLIAAEYTDETHHATNATAWMISGADQDWLQVRASTCGALADPLGCRIRLTRQRVRIIIRRR
jgi:hypothetical protein